MVTRLQRVLLSLTALSLSACGGETHEKLAPPATIQNPTKEGDLTTLTLRPEAVRRIGIATAAVEERSVHRTRTLGGELLVPAGAAITVAAPRAGTVIAPAGAEPPRAGERVTHGQPLYRLVLLPSESDLLRTREEFLVQKARLENARAKARRAEELLGQSVGSIEAHEDAEAELIQSIMLVSHYRHLEEEEGMAFGPELVLRGAEERLAPILMTALATALALLPIVAGGALPGHEIEHPMAVVITGGLVTSTLLNLLFMPALYLRYGRGARAADDALG